MERENDENNHWTDQKCYIIKGIWLSSAEHKITYFKEYLHWHVIMRCRRMHEVSPSCPAITPKTWCTFQKHHSWYSAAGASQMEGCPAWEHEEFRIMCLIFQKNKTPQIINFLRKLGKFKVSSYYNVLGIFLKNWSLMMMC